MLDEIEKRIRVLVLNRALLTDHRGGQRRLMVIERIRGCIRSFLKPFFGTQEIRSERLFFRNYAAIDNI